MSDHFMLALGLALWTLLIGSYFALERYAPQVLSWIGKTFDLTPYEKPR